jgi:hypothetical protein
MKPFKIRFLLLFALLFSASGSATAKNELSDKSDQALVREMDSLMSEMQGSLDTAFKGLQTAKSAQDVQRWVAIQSILTPMKGLVRLAQQAVLRGKESSAKGDRSGLEAAFVTIKVARIKMRELEIQLRTAGREGASTIEDGTEQVTILSQPLTILGPIYTPWGEPITENTRGSESDPTLPGKNEPIWGEHPSGGELPVYDEPPSASPFL